MYSPINACIRLWDTPLLQLLSVEVLYHQLKVKSNSNSVVSKVTTYLKVFLTTCFQIFKHDGQYLYVEKPHIKFHLHYRSFQMMKLSQVDTCYYMSQGSITNNEDTILLEFSRESSISQGYLWFKHWFAIPGYCYIILTPPFQGRKPRTGSLNMYMEQQK